jgi:ankyrin repeat protein
MTPLHLATMSGNIKIVKKLLLRGAKRELKDIKGDDAAGIAK